MTQPWMQRLPVDNPTPQVETIDTSDATRVRSELGDDPVAWASQVGLEIAHDVTAALPQLGGNAPHFLSLRRATTSTALRSLLVIAGTIDQLTTDEARAHAREFAKRGVPLGDMLRAFRIGHARLDASFAEAVALNNPDAAAVLAERRRISELLFVQVDAFATAMEAEFRDEYEPGITASAARRLHGVSRVLSGDLDDAGATAVLNYNMGTTHIGLVAWSTNSQETGKDTHLRERIGDLLASTGATEILIVPVGDGAVWAWGGNRRITLDHITELESDPAIAVAVGEPRKGLAGFRETHQEAREVENLVNREAGEQSAQHITLHRDVALPILLTRDPDAARTFVRNVLGDLTDDDPRVQQVRLTLRTYLDESRSLQATAKRLQISRNTVTYRVNRASQLCGRSIRKEHQLLHAALVAHEHVT